MIDLSVVSDGPNKTNGRDLGLRFVGDLNDPFTPVLVLYTVFKIVSTRLTPEKRDLLQRRLYAFACRSAKQVPGWDIDRLPQDRSACFHLRGLLPRNNIDVEKNDPCHEPRTKYKLEKLHTSSNSIACAGSIREAH